jgi:selenocysteine lyase/cysteine desulfurase
MKDIITLENVTELFNFKVNENTFKWIDKQRYNKLVYIKTPFHKKIMLLCADYTASGFPLKFIEKFLCKYVYPYYHNTHSNSFAGLLSAKYVEQSKRLIIDNINGDCTENKILFTGNGATGAINHLISLIKDNLKEACVMISQMEHNSNFLPWYHNAGELVILKINKDHRIDLVYFENQLKKQKRQNKKIFVSVTAASNITGVIQNTHKLAELCHKYGGKFFVDMACNFPYMPIDINHNIKKGIYYDAIFISPHKMFAVGSPGILVFRKDLICNSIPFCPGGGSVRFISNTTVPVYSNNLEVKESSGTPNVPGIVRIGLTFRLKMLFEQDIFRHELEMTKTFQKKLLSLQKEIGVDKLVILNPICNELRLPIFAIQIKPFHYNLIVKLLSDVFGISSRGGTSCSGIAADFLLDLTKEDDTKIKDYIIKDNGVPHDYGWIRITLHYTHTEKDIDFIIKAIKWVTLNAQNYENLYDYNTTSNTYNYNYNYYN